MSCLLFHVFGLFIQAREAPGVIGKKWRLLVSGAKQESKLRASGPAYKIPAVSVRLLRQCARVNRIGLAVGAVF
jgi:hypothetical protein